MNGKLRIILLYVFFATIVLGLIAITVILGGCHSPKPPDVPEQLQPCAEASIQVICDFVSAKLPIAREACVRLLELVLEVATK